MSVFRGLLSGCVALAFFVIAPCASFSQDSAPVAHNQVVVPQSMHYSGAAPNHAGETVEATFRIYAAQEGGDALWSETQRVAVAQDGKYTALLGAATEGGLPQTVFAAGQGRWLSVSVEGTAEPPRVQLASVAYAMKAADAETLGGLPAGEFVTRSQLRDVAPNAPPSDARPGTAETKIRANAAPSGSGTANTIAMWTGASTLGNSALTQSGNNVTAAGSLSGNSKITTTDTAAVLGTQSSATGVVYGVGGTATSTTANAAGVIGYEYATTGQVYGVFGNTGTSTGSAAGVFGHEGSSTGAVFGVLGTTGSGTNGASGVHGNEGSASGVVSGVSGGTNSSTDGAAGVNGNEGSLTGWVHGVVGGTSSSSMGAAGVLGNEGSATGQVYGVAGNTNSKTASAAGVYGSEGSLTGVVYGVSGYTASTTANAAAVNGNEGALKGAVYGVNGYTNSVGPGAAAVNGYEGATTGLVNGVNGNIASTTNGAAGVSGYADGTKGATFGVNGGTNSDTDGAAGVNGYSAATSGAIFGVAGGTNSATASAAGVKGSANAETGQIYGVSGNTNSATQGAAGVYGFEGTKTGSVAGVVGDTTSSTGEGVHGSATATSGHAVGVVGVTSSAAGAGGEFINLSGSGLVLQGFSGAAYKSVFTVDASGNGFFNGNLNVTGKMTKGSGSFKIDDPLDPANKYLSHSFVESPDMMNVYNGNIKTDRHGVATVILPEYFEALNRDFRYQLTVIGQFAQAIVAEKIAGNRFRIRTNKPNVEVSWQVTGIRQDAYANANRIPVEEDKPRAEQGYYLHPEVFGQPANKSVAAASDLKRARNPGAPGSR